MGSYRFECTHGERQNAAKTIRARDDMEAMRIALAERTQPGLRLMAR